LSYKPLNGTPPDFILGVAVLLVRFPNSSRLKHQVNIVQMLVIIMSSTFYAVVDWNASRVMKSIKNLVAEQATVVRDGRQQTVPSPDIVVGDLVMLSMGDRVPADMRIVQVSSDLKFDRSLLTGER
jgi:sodium/potassium-transporting ATPase subunit alpha